MSEEFAKRATVGAVNALEDARQGGIKDVGAVMQRAALRTTGSILRRHVEDAANEQARIEAAD